MPAAAHWFVDANTTGLGHVLSAAHLPVTWIGDDGRKGRRKERHWLSPCPVRNHGEPDEVWIPAIAATGAAILTRDEHIASRLLEHEAVRTAAAQMLAITSAGDLDLWARPGSSRPSGTAWTPCVKSALGRSSSGSPERR